jgi:hypothetical protein
MMVKPYREMFTALIEKVPCRFQWVDRVISGPSVLADQIPISRKRYKITGIAES